MFAALSMPATIDDNSRVDTAHSFTGRMCAASRWIEGQRKDALFADPLGYKLAGAEGRASPMGDWIMTPRTRFADDLVKEHYDGPAAARQLVLLGAGMDSRAFRMTSVDELAVYEVDQPTTFDIKEPLVADEKLGVSSRTTVATDFTDRGAWAKQLAATSFDAAVPTVWILEGLLMYLSLRDTEDLMRQIGELSAPGSVVFHDAVSANYVAGGRGPVVGGAPFIGGSDDYKGMWREHAGFGEGYARDFSSIKVDRAQRKLRFDDGVAEATPARCRGNSVVLFVVAQK